MCVCVYVFVCLSEYVFVCLSEYVFVCASVCVRVACMYVCVYVCVHGCMYACLCIIYVCVNLHVYFMLAFDVTFSCSHLEVQDLPLGNDLITFDSLHDLKAISKTTNHYILAGFCKKGFGIYTAPSFM